MNILLSGGAKCGKSALAQQIAVSMGTPRYYVATLIPSCAEDDARIRRHLAEREGQDFATLECFYGILDCLPYASGGAVFLLDSVTSLLQNVLFPPQKGYAIDLPAAARCIDELVFFAERAKNVVFVSDNIYCDEPLYAESTEQYRRLLAQADRRLAAVCDTVIEVCAGQSILYKGNLP